MSLLPPPAGLWEAPVQFVLASASPARLATLRGSGVAPLVRVSDVDEDAVLVRLLAEQPAAGPGAQVQALAEAKAADVLARLRAGAGANHDGADVTSSDTERHPTPVKGLDLAAPTIVVGCDSMLEIDGKVVGKPADAREARERLRTLSGGSGVLHTGHSVRFCPTGLTGPDPKEGGAPLREAGGTSATTVHFATLTEAEIEAYVDSGEPLHVAGSFTIDGLGGPFVTGIEGDHHGVVGISLPLLRLLLMEVGIAWPALWKSSRQPEESL